MSVTLAPELAEVIKESAERQGISFDDWVVAAAELKFRAGDEAEAFEEAEEKRRRARATRTKDVVDATVALLAKTGDKVYTSDLGDLQGLCTATGFKPWSSAVEAAPAGGAGRPERRTARPAARRKNR